MQKSYLREQQNTLNLLKKRNTFGKEQNVHV